MEFLQDVLHFWFGPKDAAKYGDPRSIWFESTEKQDAEIRDRFLTTYEHAATGALDKHKTDAEGCLALIITLDQFPRNMFRGTARSFEEDERALEHARWAVARGFDEGYPSLIRIFFYLPFEHSEELQDQQRCMDLTHALPDYENKPRNIKFAQRHLEIIERFGRFSHRNEILSRDSTLEETEFLKEPDSSFIWPKHRQNRSL